MKRLTTLAILAAVLMALAASVSAEQARKLPESAYIKSARIEMSNAEAKRDTTFYISAQAMLDSLFLYYGPNLKPSGFRAAL